jgi:glycosyltransferase involved in cell wall biosynthesis
MKILYYSAHPNLNLTNTAGYGTHMREMINAFRELGHKVLPVIIGGTKINSIVSPNNKIRSLVKKIMPKILWETIKDIKLLKIDNLAEKRLEKEIKDFKPDLIYERAAYMQTSGVNIAKKLNIRHVMEFNSPYVEERQVFSGKSLLLNKGNEKEAKQLNLTDKVIVVSTPLKKYFINKHLISEKKIIVTPNAININYINTNENKVEELKEKLKLKNKIVIGFVGSIVKWHGVDLLVKAFGKLTEDHPEIKLLIVGDGEPMKELKTLAEPFKEQTIFTGYIPHSDVSSYIRLMNITVMAKSNWYGSPIKIFEYGAFGKAIIASDLDPISEVMEDGKDGLLIDINVNELKEKMSILIADINLRKRLGQNFKTKIFEKYQWKNNVKRVLENEN